MPVVADRKATGRCRRLKVADLAFLPAELPSGPVHYELNNGELVVKSAPGAQRGAIDFKLAASLLVAAEQRGYGKAVVGDVMLVLWRDPDRVVNVDAAFYRKERLPICRCEAGFLESPPDLAVEVRSRDDSTAYLEEKIKDLHAFGVRVVLLIDPQQRTAMEYRPGQPGRKIPEGGRLVVPDLMPKVEVDVADLFAE